MIYLDVAKEIERKRRRLHESIEKNGINSEETRRISIEIDNLLNEYYRKEKQYNENNTMIVFYEKSIKELKNLTLDSGGFPNVKLWNEYALKNKDFKEIITSSSYMMSDQSFSVSFGECYVDALWEYGAFGTAGARADLPSGWA